MLPAWGLRPLGDPLSCTVDDDINVAEDSPAGRGLPVPPLAKPWGCGLPRGGV